MGSSQPTPHKALERPAITTDVKRICVAGFNYSPPCGRSRKVASLIAAKYPTQYETWFYFDSQGCYYDFLAKNFGDDKIVFPNELKGHDTAPFVWIERKNGENNYLGQNVTFLKWATETFKEDKEICEAASVEWSYSDLMHHQCCIQATSKLSQAKATAEENMNKVKVEVTNK